MEAKEFFAGLRSYALAGTTALCAIYAALSVRNGIIGEGAAGVKAIVVEFRGPAPFEGADAEAREAVGAIRAGTPLSSIDIGQVLGRISALGWVRRAAVSRGYPDEVRISVEPREIIAYIWQGGEYRPVDSEGRVVGMKARDISGPVISGEGAEARVADMLATLGKYPRIYSNLAGMQLVNGLRWNLALYGLEGGLVIKLPDEGEDAALAKISEYDRRHDILKRSISEIDARDPSRLLVKPRGRK